MIDPKDVRMTDPEDIGAELMEHCEQPRNDDAMYAIYSATDEYRLCGFVRGDRAVRMLPLVSDAACYVSRLPCSDERRQSELRHLRLMEGIPSC